MLKQQEEEEEKKKIVFCLAIVQYVKKRKTESRTKQKSKS